MKYQHCPISVKLPHAGYNSAVISTNKTALQYFDKVFVTPDLPLSEELPASQALIS
jgi:hypothetical protein